MIVLRVSYTGCGYRLDSDGRADVVDRETAAAYVVLALGLGLMVRAVDNYSRQLLAECTNKFK